MDKDNCLVKVQGEDGKTFDMLILKEFDYKDKRYAILSEFDACGCSDDCDCDDECDCGCESDECTCGDDCECGCHEENHECHCECDEPMLCILEIAKDKDGSEVFKSIDDEKLFNELVEEADKYICED